MHSARIKQNALSVIDDKILHRLYRTLSVFAFGTEPNEFMVVVFIQKYTVNFVVVNHILPPVFITNINFFPPL